MHNLYSYCKLKGCCQIYNSIRQRNKILQTCFEVKKTHKKQEIKHKSDLPYKLLRDMYLLVYSLHCIMPLSPHLEPTEIRPDERGVERG